MESLPFELVAKILDLLRLKQKIMLRSVGPDWKAIAEAHLLHVRCIKCHPDLVCRFGCRSQKEEICPDACYPDIFLKIMALCPNVQQLALIPCTVNAFRAPPGSGDCGAGAWRQICSTGLGDTKCLTWDGLDLDKPMLAQNLKHLSCGRISSAALTPVIQVSRFTVLPFHTHSFLTLHLVGQNLEGLFYSHTDFNDWASLPYGMKYLRTGTEGQFIPIVTSRATETIVDLELAGKVPVSLPHNVTLSFPKLEKFTYYSAANASTDLSLDVMRRIFDNSPKLRKLKLEILFDDDQYFLHYLPKFFESLTHMEINLYMVTLRKEHCIAESLFTMVSHTPLVVDATIRIPDMSDDELLTMTQWSRLKTLKLYSSKPAFRGTAFSIFIELMFGQSLNELVTSNVVFSKSEQEMLLRTTKKFNLIVNYEDDWKKPVLRPFVESFDEEKKFIRMIFTKDEQVTRKLTDRPTNSLTG